MSEVRLNVQGLARKEALLMGCLRAPPGRLICSSDASAGEPSVTTHFSQDPNYRWATFDGVGKAPLYQGSTLMIDDIYLMGMSQSPAGADTLRAAFERAWPGGTFAEQWLLDPEIIKAALKGPRQLHKAMILGFGYGMGATKAQKTLYEQGFDVLLRDCKEFHKNYWRLFHGVKAFSDRLARQVETDGYLINPFGYRGVPPPHKAFNFFIQSSVSGLMHVYLRILSHIAPYMRLITVIHDELLFDIPEDRAADIQVAIREATAELNRQLSWTVNLRFGCVLGRNWYEAK